METKKFNDYVLATSLLDKVKLFNKLREWIHCDDVYEYIFDLEDDGDKDLFIHLYGTQTYLRCEKESCFWLGGYNYYDNIKNRCGEACAEIIAITKDNIDECLTYFELDEPLKIYDSQEEMISCIGGTFNGLFNIADYYNDNFAKEEEREITFNVRVKYKCPKNAERDDYTAFCLALQPDFNTKEDGVYLIDVESDFVERL